MLSVDLFLLETWQRFQSLCFHLARADHAFAVAMGMSWDGGRDVSIIAHVEGKTVHQAALQCKFVKSLGSSTKKSIRTSLDAVDKIQVPEKWILCLPIDPTEPFLRWLSEEMDRRGMPWECWGRSELLARLEQHPHIFQVFFYRVYAELERLFVYNELELRRFTLDTRSQWVQPDPNILLFAPTGNVASPDLAFDITVRNRGKLEAALLKIHARVAKCQPVPHGIPEHGLLLSKITYRLSIRQGQSGDYQEPCEPPLLVAPHSHQRFKICLTDTGYSWSGVVQVALDYGDGALMLPCIELHT